MLRREAEGMLLFCFIYSQKPRKISMAVARFKFIVSKLASQRIQLQFAMLNLFRQRSSMVSLLLLGIASEIIGSACPL